MKGGCQFRQSPFFVMVMVHLPKKKMVMALEGHISKNGMGAIYSDSIYSATRFLLKAVGCLKVLGF